MNHHPARGILYLCLGVLVFSVQDAIINIISNPVNSTVPKLELKCPPVFDTDWIKRCRNSWANAGKRSGGSALS